MTKETFDYFLNRENAYNEFYSINPKPFNPKRSLFAVQDNISIDLSDYDFNFLRELNEAWKKFCNEYFLTPEYERLEEYELIAIFPKDATDQEVEDYFCKGSSPLKIDHADKTYVYEVHNTFKPII